MRCDGLVVATPQGSTGYNLANGGPVLAWGVEGYVVSFIAPHSLTARALVVAPGRRADDQQRVPRGAGRGPRRRPPDPRAPAGRGHPRRVRPQLRNARPAPGRVLLPPPARALRPPRALAAVSSVIFQPSSVGASVSRHAATRTSACTSSVRLTVILPDPQGGRALRVRAAAAELVGGGVARQLAGEIGPVRVERARVGLRVGGGRDLGGRVRNVSAAAAEQRQRAHQDRDEDRDHDDHQWARNTHLNESTRAGFVTELCRFCAESVSPEAQTRPIRRVPLVDPRSVLHELRVENLLLIERAELRLGQA